jgi:hypothetical protein
MTLKNKIIEKLAELEHEQWRSWRKHVEEQNPDIQKSIWLQFKYEDLPDAQKEEDRIWARKVLAIVEQARDAILKELDKLDTTFEGDIGNPQWDCGWDAGLHRAKEIVRRHLV